MSTLPPHDSPAVYWIDAQLQQQGPETLATVIERLAYQQIPETTPVWWQGATTWTAFNSNPELVSLLETRMQPAAEPAYVAPVAEAAYAEPAYAQPAHTEPVYTEPVYAEPTYAAVAEPVYAEPTYGTTAEPAASPFAPTADASPGFTAVAGSTNMFDAAPTNGASAAMPTIVMPEAAPQASQPLFGAGAAAAAPVAAEPEPQPAPAPALNLGDTAALGAAFASMQQRYQAHAAERARATRLDDTLAATLQHAATGLGFTIDTHALTDDHHSFTLAAPDGSTASLTVGRIPPAANIAAAIEQPLPISVQHGGTASTGLFVGDVLHADDSIDLDGLTRTLAAVVFAAGQNA